jgi:hypothetical protein
MPASEEQSDDDDEIEYPLLDRSRFYVRILVDDKVLNLTTINGCGWKVCDFESFYRFVNYRLISEDLHSLCLSHLNYEELNTEGVLQLGIVICIVISMILISLFAINLCLIRLKGYYQPLPLEDVITYEERELSIEKSGEEEEV